MKNVLASCFILAVCAAYGQQQVVSVTGPSPVCPGPSNVYTATYFTAPTNPYFYEFVSSIQWTFSQNGQVLSVSNSTGFPPQTGGAQAPVTMAAPSNIQVGTVHLEVRMTGYAQFYPAFYPQLRISVKTMDFVVGLATPATITGPTYLCPGGSGTYTAAPVANAQSYKWEVPSYYTVNGINGPVVTTASRTVTIAVPPCDNNGFRRNYPLPEWGTVKVSAVSPTCGTSGSKSMTVYIDYPTSIITTENADGSTTFAMNYTSFPEYYWIRPFPPGWQLVSDQGYQITFFTNNIEAQISMEYRSSCGCVYGLAVWWEPPPPPPPPPCCGEVIQAYPIPAVNTLNVRYPKGTVPELFIDGKAVPILKQAGPDLQIDISNLPQGPHVLQINGPSGLKTIRFVKATL